MTPPARKQITLDQAITLVSTYACPGDFGCLDWPSVKREALKHVDGAAVALEIDNEYQITHEARP